MSRDPHNRNERGETRILHRHCEIPVMWDAVPSEKSWMTLLNATDFGDKRGGITLAVRAQRTGVAVSELSPPPPPGRFDGILALKISYTDLSQIETIVDLPEQGTIWIPNRRCIVSVRLEPPFPGASQVDSTDKIKVYGEAMRGRHGGDGSLRRTIVATEPDAVGPSRIFVPQGAKRVQIIPRFSVPTFGSPATMNLDYIGGLDLSGTPVAYWSSQQYFNIAGIGFMGWEIPPNVKQLAFYGNLGTPSSGGFFSCVFQMGI